MYALCTYCGYAATAFVYFLYVRHSRVAAVAGLGQRQPHRSRESSRKQIHLFDRAVLRLLTTSVMATNAKSRTEHLGVRVPIVVADAVRKRAGSTDSSVSEVLREAIIAGLDSDIETVTTTVVTRGRYRYGQHLLDLEPEHSVTVP